MIKPSKLDGKVKYKLTLNRGLMMEDVIDSSNGKFYIKVIKQRDLYSYPKLSVQERVVTEVHKAPKVQSIIKKGKYVEVKWVMEMFRVYGEYEPELDNLLNNWDRLIKDYDGRVNAIVYNSSKIRTLKHLKSEFNYKVGDYHQYYTYIHSKYYLSPNWTGQKPTIQFELPVEYRVEHPEYRIKLYVSSSLTTKFIEDVRPVVALKDDFDENVISVDNLKIQHLPKEQIVETILEDYIMNVLST